VVVEQVVHLILVLMVAVEEEAVVSVTFHLLLFLLRLHSPLQLVMEEQVVIHIVLQLLVDPQLNQEVVEQAQYLIHQVAVAYLPLLQLAVVLVVLEVVMVNQVDLEVANRIQEVVETEVLEEQNREQIQHLKEILLTQINQALRLDLMGVVVAVEQIQLTLIQATRQETQVYLSLV
jgi:hypothetical protein